MYKMLATLNGRIMTALLFFPVYIQAQFGNNLPEISSEALLKTVSALSSPEMAGRLPGYEGYRRAATLMADAFADAGLQPAFGGSFYQFFDIEHNFIIGPCYFTITDASGNELFPTIGLDYTFRGFTGSAKVDTDVIFAGYGIDAEGLTYSDYRDIPVAGKVVMVFRTNPTWSDKSGLSWPEATPRQKAKMAARHGARAVLLVSPPGDRETLPEVYGSMMDGEGEHLHDFPLVVISRLLADRILSGTGLMLQDVWGQITVKHHPVTLPTKNRIKLSVETRYSPMTKTCNVIGLLPGRHEVLKNEYVVVGAHLDHVGSQCGEIYFPGANDNASGCAAVLEIARVLCSITPTPDRSVIFVLFSSEEQGLLGARHFVNTLPSNSIAHEKVIAMLNFDCIAHGDSIQLGNGHSAPALWKLARSKDLEKRVVDRTWSGGGADATPFFEAGIPALYFVSTNSYTYLHSTGDLPGTLNPELFSRIATLGLRTALATVYESSELKD